jgi:hypothetical protein
MSRIIRSALAALLCLFCVAAWAADPVAFISDLKGEVTLDGAGRPPFLAELLAGSRLSLAAGAAASVMYVVTGDEYGLKGPGEFTVAKDGVKTSNGAVASKRVASLRPSTPVIVQTSKAATASLRMRSAPPAKAEPAGPQYPVNARIATLQPVLRWGGDANATYTVVVSAADGKEAYRGAVKGLTHRLPVKLSPATTYVWSLGFGTPQPVESRFETLAPATIQAADKARAGAKSFADRVLLALVLRDLGAAEDSREVWFQLAIERPDIPELHGLAR